MLGGGALFPGFYLNELLMKLLAREDAHPRLFDAYADTLAALADEAPALRAFELLLLRELGWLPELGVQTLTLQAVAGAARYTLHPEGGLVADGDGLPGAAWVQLEAALAHGAPAALRAACAAISLPLRSPLRALLHYHLGPSKLRTRQVMLDVQKLAGTVAP
jgi:DNA repair protein RecO (recombination protein O)